MTAQQSSARREQKNEDEFGSIVTLFNASMDTEDR